MANGSKGVALLAGVAFAFMAVMFPAFGDAPESGNQQNVTLAVIPDLLSGPTSGVVVTGSGFPPNTTGVLRQCTADLSSQVCDQTLVVPFTTTSSGDVPPTSVTVKRTIDPAGPSTFNCGITVCALVASAGSAVSQHQIRFAGAGTTPPTSTSTTSTSTTSTSTTSTSTTSTSTTSTTAPLGLAAVCSTLRDLAAALPVAAEILRSVTLTLGCPLAA